MRMIGLDIGDVRIGIAVCDDGEIIASGVEVYTRTGDPERDAAYIAKKAAELEGERIVLGLPVNMNGTLGPACDKVKDFAASLGEKSTIEQDFMDERLTTAQAEHVLIQGGVRRNKRRLVVDKMAAQLILQSYIDQRRNRFHETVEQ